MKFKSCFAVMLLSVCLAVSAFTLKPKTSDLKVNPQVDSAVAVNLSSSNKSSKVLAARFLNMLNHNFVYDDAFYSVNEIVNLSVVANLQYADETSEFIPFNIIASYAYDMYGVKLDGYVGNPEFPQKDGYIYIIPRGYTVYKHTNAIITENEDGTYTVKTTVSVDGHDSSAKTLTATSLFVKNPNSSFGYNIVSSDISDNSLIA